MNDALNQLLVLQLNQAAGQVLWFADENLSAAGLRAIHPRPELTAVTNRHDVWTALNNSGIKTILSDFDFSSVPGGQLHAVVYRVSKERALVNHCINHAFNMLAEDGQLVLLGGKQDGLKTNARHAASVFGSKAQIKKHGIQYVATIRKAAVELQLILDSSNYSQLRPVEADGLAFVSKPGIFGWNKVDRGSALLVEALEEQLSSRAALDTSGDISLLDLGCGYGYLLLATQTQPFARRVGTDNNAAAVLAARANMEASGIDAEITLDDCGSQLTEQFDLLLCNPPFHHGFGASRDLTIKFLSQIRQLITLRGQALLVVNQFIPLEAVAAEYFGNVELVAANESFKVVSLRGPRRRS